MEGTHDQRILGRGKAYKSEEAALTLGSPTWDLCSSSLPGKPKFTNKPTRSETSTQATHQVPTINMKPCGCTSCSCDECKDCGCCVRTPQQRPEATLDLLC